ncbi:MAG: hypothetical protein RPU40_13785, partial [Candidatus Sedimenticola sp. (ex Thyasira tokunagai)]
EQCARPIAPKAGLLHALIQKGSASLVGAAPPPCTFSTTWHDAGFIPLPGINCSQSTIGVEQ